MYNSKYVKGDYDMVNWENNIRRVVPYTPGEQPDQPDMIKLNTNENPYPPAGGYGFSFVFSLIISGWSGCSPGVYGTTLRILFSQFTMS